jgi:hypothetical protein
MGSIAGPPGAITGAVIGGIVGATTARGLDLDEERESFHDGELDEQIGVTSKVLTIGRGSAAPAQPKLGQSPSR